MRKIHRSSFLYILVSSVWLLLSSCSHSYRVDESLLVLQRGQLQLTLTAYQDDTFEVLIHSIDQQPFPSFAKKEQIESQPLVVVEQDHQSITLLNGVLKAKVYFDDWRVEYFRGKEKLTTQIGFSVKERQRGFKFSLSEKEQILGGGQRILGMDRRGHRMPLYNRAHYGYTTESNQMYYSLPAVMSSKKYVIGFDNSASGVLDIGKAEPNTLEFESVGGRASYLMTAQETYPKLIESFTQVVGRQPLPARWTLGNFASRFGYRSQQQVLETVEKFNQESIPVDAIILDLFWFGKDIKGHLGNLSWERDNFPEPEKMIATLSAQGIKTIVITEPFILSSSKRWQEAVDHQLCATDAAGQPLRFDFYFGNTCVIDVFNQKAIDWFSGIYNELTEQGIAGQWGDLGEPEVHPDNAIHQLSEYGIHARGDEVHNVFGHQWAKLVYQQQREKRPNTRPMIMMRSGFLGTQRYGIIPWTGDVDRSWGGLQSQVELSLQMGVLGLAYTHSDLGGFAGGETFYPELYIRWLQYGVFQPVFRPHAQDHISPEPVFHDRETIRRAREAINLRYQLTPYVYSMAIENSLTGLPLMRPLFFDTSASFNRKDSYFWGESMLIHPIARPGVKKERIELPSGVWFDFFKGERFDGTNTLDYQTSIESIPVFIKAGSFVPMVAPFQRMQDYSTEQLQVHFYADESVSRSSYRWYHDDGMGVDNLAKDRFETTDFTFSSSDQQWLFSIERELRASEGLPKTRQLTLVLHNVQAAPAKVMLDGQLQTTSVYQKAQRTLTIKVPQQQTKHQLTIQFLK